MKNLLFMALEAVPAIVSNYGDFSDAPTLPEITIEWVIEVAKPYCIFIWQVIESLSIANASIGSTISLVIYDFCRDKKSLAYMIKSLLLAIVVLAIGCGLGI